MLSSLASPTPPGGGEPTELGDEENTTKSQSDLQGAGRRGSHQKGEEAGRVSRAIPCPLHSDH